MKKTDRFAAAVLVFLLLSAAGCNRPISSESSGATTLPRTTDAVSTVPSNATLPTELPPQPTNPSTSPTETLPPGTEPPTEPETAPPEPTSPEMPPNQPLPEMIGSLYTREQLMAMDNRRIEHGCGHAKDGLPSAGVLSVQKEFGRYNCYFYVPDSKDVFLTFDCGYEPTLTDAQGNPVRYTERVLDTLKEKNVKATFFLNLQFCVNAPDLVQRMVDEGHAIGNHTAYHIFLPDCSIDRGVNDILYMQRYIKENFGYTMYLFRPSSGVYSHRSLALVQSLGYTTMNWSATYRDWDPENQPDPEASLQAMVADAHGGAIYLFHSLSSTTASFLGSFIDTLTRQGYNLTIL